MLLKWRGVEKLILEAACGGNSSRLTACGKHKHFVSFVTRLMMHHTHFVVLFVFIRETLFDLSDDDDDEEKLLLLLLLLLCVK